MKKKKLLTLTGTICLAMVLTVLTILGGCAKPAPAPAPTPTKVYEWRLQSFLPAGMWLYHTLVKDFADNVNEMSDGRLVITPYPGEALIPSAEILDAVSKGVIEIANGSGGTFAGKIPVAGIASTFPFTVKSYWEWDILFWEKRWVDVLRDAYAEYNVYYVGPSTGPGNAIMSTKPIRSLDDLGKMKIRTYGFAANVLTAVGVSTVYIPGGEIYTGLATGVIDGCTYGAVTSQWDLKVHEVAKYYLKTLIGEQAGENIIVNLDEWNELPDDLKKIVEIATREMCHQRMRHYYVSETTLLKKMVTEHGVTVTELPEADIKELTEASMAILDEEAVKEPKYSGPAVKQLKDFLRELGYIS